MCGKTPSESKFILIGYFLTAFCLIACSRKNIEWRHPVKSENSWNLDKLNCKDHANGLLVRDLEINDNANIPSRDDLQIQFAKFDRQKKYRSFFKDCMLKKGYNLILGKSLE